MHIFDDAHIEAAPAPDSVIAAGFKSVSSQKGINFINNAKGAAGFYDDGVVVGQLEHDTFVLLPPYLGDGADCSAVLDLVVDG